MIWRRGSSFGNLRGGASPFSFLPDLKAQLGFWDQRSEGILLEDTSYWLEGGARSGLFSLS